MNKVAIYPGTFDPITFGHIDVIKKSLKIFDKIIVATTDNNDKNYFFSVEERIDIINNSLFKDLKMNKKKIKLNKIDSNYVCRDFTYIDDVIISIILIFKYMNKKKIVDIFNIGNGNPVKLLDFVELLEEALSIKATKVFENIQPGDVESTYASTQNLEDWIGYRPLVTIKEGVNKFANWYLDYYQ